MAARHLNMRAPQATDGCVAVANPDLERIIRTVQIRTTPVLFAQQINWVHSRSLASEKAAMEKLLRVRSEPKSAGNSLALHAFYAPDFHADGRNLATHQATLHADAARLRGRVLKDVSILSRSDEAQIRVVTFAQMPAGARLGKQVRQYWERRGAAWKIVYETELKLSAQAGPQARFPTLQSHAPRRARVPGSLEAPRAWSLSTKMSTHGRRQRVYVDRTLFIAYAKLLDCADAFFDNHLRKLVQVDLAPGFASTRAVIATVLEFGGFDRKRLHSLTRGYSGLH